MNAVWQKYWPDVVGFEERAGKHLPGLDEVYLMMFSATAVSQGYFETMCIPIKINLCAAILIENFTEIEVGTAFFVLRMSQTKSTIPLYWKLCVESISYYRGNTLRRANKTVNAGSLRESQSDHSSQQISSPPPAQWYPLPLFPFCDSNMSVR